MGQTSALAAAVAAQRSPDLRAATQRLGFPGSPV